MDKFTYEEKLKRTQKKTYTKKTEKCIVFN